MIKKLKNMKIFEKINKKLLNLIKIGPKNYWQNQIKITNKIIEELKIKIEEEANKYNNKKLSTKIKLKSMKKNLMNLKNKKIKTMKQLRA